METTLSAGALERLLHHLVDFEEKKGAVIEQYFPRPSRERNQLRRLIDTYYAAVEELIETAQKVDGDSLEVPFVAIGCEVRVRNLGNGESTTFRVVDPFQSGGRNGDVSYLSPMGQSLLLKRVGDRVSVRAPGGLFEYEIQSIHLGPAEG